MKKYAALLVLLAGCASPASATMCEPPDSLDACRWMERAGLVSVTCPRDPQSGALLEGGAYASPNDDCDDTAGIVAATKRARARSTVWLPAGELSPWPESSPYIVSASIDVGACHVRGERAASHHQGTRVIVAPGVGLKAAAEGCDVLPLTPLADPLVACGGGAVFRGGGNVRIEDVVIEAGPHAYWPGERGSAAFGVYLSKSHGYQIERLIVRGATSAGVVLDYSHLGVVRDSIVNGGAGDGWRFIGASGAMVYGVGASLNGRHGVVVTTRPQASAAATGEVQFLGGDVESNGGIGVYLLGVAGGLVQGMRSEGNAWDGIRADSVSLLTLASNRIIPGPRVDHPLYPNEARYHGLALFSCRACRVHGNVISGAGGTEDIWTEGDMRYPWIRENLYFGGTIPTDYPGGTAGGFEVVVATNPNTPLARYSQHGVSVGGTAAPAGGQWRAGDVVWSRLSTGPRGWVCAQTAGLYSYTCAAWAPIGAAP